jgi:hypothetical protein
VLDHPRLCTDSPRLDSPTSRPVSNRLQRPSPMPPRLASSCDPSFCTRI